MKWIASVGLLCLLCLALAMAMPDPQPEGGDHDHDHHHDEAAAEPEASAAGTNIPLKGFIVWDWFRVHTRGREVLGADGFLSDPC